MYCLLYTEAVIQPAHSSSEEFGLQVSVDSMCLWQEVSWGSSYKELEPLYHIIYSSMDRYLGCFPFLAIVKNNAVNIVV